MTKKRPDTNKSILMIILCTILTSTGQVMMKFSVSSLDSAWHILTNIPLIIGLILYAVASVILIMALKNGDLSLLYPFIALGFVWVTLASIFLFNEHVSLMNWAGITSIIFGVSFLGAGKQ
jgi:multidrug transporter EmrE-like cation transporter